MQIAARSYLSAGVALVGAGAIAISPIAPPLPDAKVPTLSTIGVELNAAVNPIQTWIEVFGQAAENLAVLGQTVAENPAPILQQVITNQLSYIEQLAPALEEFFTGVVASLDPTNPDGIPANLREAFELIVGGNPAEGIPAIMQAFLQPILFPSLALLMPVQGIITQTAQNVLDVANQALTVFAVGAIAVLTPVFSGFNAAGAAAQAVVDAANVGDIAGVITAVLDIPGVVVGGVLNGFGFDGGLLTPESGTVAAFLTLRQMIADALKPDLPALRVADVSSTKTEATETVTLDLTDSGVTPAAFKTEVAGGEEAQSPGAEPGDGVPVVDEKSGDEVVDETPAEEAPQEEAPDEDAPEEEEALDEETLEDTLEEDASEEETGGDDTTEQEPSEEQNANDDNANDDNANDPGEKETGTENTGGDAGGAEA